VEKRLSGFYSSPNAMMSEALHHFGNLAEKTTAIYVEQGFLDPVIRPGRVIFDESTQVVTREVRVEAGHLSRVARLEINGEFPENLPERLRLQEGSIFNPLFVAEDEITVEEFYEERGHWKTRVSATVEKSENRSDVVLRYDLETRGIARVGSIQVRGNHTTIRSVILRKLGLKEGETITRIRLAQAQGRLYDMGLFERVDIRLQETEVPGLYDLIVDVVESKRYQISYGGRYDSEKDWEGDVELSDLNLFGTAQALSLYGRLNSNERLYKLLYNSPSLFGWNWNAFFVAERTNRTDLDIQQTNLIFQQAYRLWKPFLLQAGYIFKRVTTRLFNPIDNVFEKFVLDISEVQSTLLADTRDNPIDATRGSFFSTSMEYAPASLGSSAIFLKSYNQFYYYRRISSWIWASAVRLGLATTLQQETLVRSERFFAGGSDTIRGFRFNEVGPRNPFLDEPFGGEAVFILNEELRFPIHKWFRGVVFYDGGNVFTEVSDFSLGDLRHTAGFGVRLATPYGLIGRFDLGFNLQPENDEPRSVFHFSLGQAF
jgi:outer membrane protein assembly complex protein YaeT